MFTWVISHGTMLSWADEKICRFLLKAPIHLELVFKPAFDEFRVRTVFPTFPVSNFYFNHCCCEKRHILSFKIACANAT